jgi:hypothetical protein
MPIDAKKVEQMKVWYACFMTIMDTKEWPDAKKMRKLRDLAQQTDVEMAKPN